MAPWNLTRILRRMGATQPPRPRRVNGEKNILWVDAFAGHFLAPFLAVFRRAWAGIRVSFPSFMITRFVPV
jgi:hypothetical protein